ncbi:MAG: Type 1 glutamine amidotransferase-like domain-containing protein [Patescibacteria group bacterium]|nr:Type 1 glutamine amidotransferase-like domain-containing protein [Patescibacteria group bacterium]
MKKIYLTSQFSSVAQKIAQDIGLDHPRTAFIYTAAEQEYLEDEWFVNSKKALTDNGFDIVEYSITGKTFEEIAEFISGVDVIYVCGGNTFYLLEKTLESGFDKILRNVLDDKIYIGHSAGSVLLGNSVALKSNPPKTSLTNFDGLKMVNFTIVPHWGKESARDAKLALFEKMYDLGDNVVLLKDGSYIFTDGNTFEIR